jgi:hypothetical protein
VATRGRSVPDLMLARYGCRTRADNDASSIVISTRLCICLSQGEHGLRRDGDSYIERVLRSTLRDVARKLTFIAIALEIFREGVHAIRPGSGQNDEQRQ